MTKEIKKFLNSVDFGEEIKRDYYGDYTEGYNHDKLVFNQAKLECKKLLLTLGKISEQEMVDACKRAFMGRVEWNGQDKAITYTAGQFYDLEVPQAMQSVLEYIKNNRI